MTVTVYRSTDAGAPNVLAGTIGTLITVLDACLVNGYGAKAGAGWTKPFSGTNLAAYKQGSGCGFYLRVDDSALAVQAKAVGYETMFDVNTGTNAFPTSGQLSTGVYFPKSSTADAVVRPWVVVATSKAFYLYVHYDETNITASSTYKLIAFFGDFTSYKSGDAYNCAIVGSNAVNASVNNFGLTASALNVSLNGHYVARSYTQVGGSINAGKVIDSARNGATYRIGNAGASTPYPSPITGGIDMCPVVVTEGASGQIVARGEMPGLYAPLHTLPANHYDTFSGSGELTGKTFQLFDCHEGSGIRCRAALEISDTW